MSSGALPPLFHNTSTDRGALPVVLAYIGASITVLVTTIRLFLTIAKKHPIRSDDYFFVTGALLALISSILLERAVDSGLGRHAHTLSRADLNDTVRLNYASTLLGIFSQSAAKISVAFLFERIAPRQDKRGVTILLAAIGVWVVLAVFGTAFSCSGHVSWDAKCTSGSWVAFPIVALDAVTDAMLAFWMVPRIWGLQAKLEHRLVPILLMASRALVVLAEIGLLGVLGRLKTRPAAQQADATWYGVDAATVTM
jgi:hypothetical protein